MECLGLLAVPRGPRDIHLHTSPHAPRPAAPHRALSAARAPRCAENREPRERANAAGALADPSEGAKRWACFHGVLWKAPALLLGAPGLTTNGASGVFLLDLPRPDRMSGNDVTQKHTGLPQHVYPAIPMWAKPSSTLRSQVLRKLGGWMPFQHSTA